MSNTTMTKDKAEKHWIPDLTKEKTRSRCALVWFDSVSEIFDFVLTAPFHPSHVSDRSSDRRDDPMWHGSASIRHFRHQWLNGGWPEAAKEATYISDHIKTLILGAVDGGQQMWTQSPGDWADLGRAIEGEPEFNSLTLPNEGIRPLHIVVNGCVHSGVNIQETLVRAITVAAMVDCLEALGYRCAISLWDMNNGGREGDFLGMRGVTRLAIATLVKSQNAPLNIADLVMSVGHPSMFRRLTFGTYERLPNVMNSLGSGYGWAANRDTEPLAQDPMPVDMVVNSAPYGMDHKSVHNYLMQAFRSMEGKIEVTPEVDQILSDVSNDIIAAAKRLKADTQRRIRAWRAEHGDCDEGSDPRDPRMTDDGQGGMGKGRG